VTSPNASVGDVYVDIHPDASGFAARLRAACAPAAQSVGNDIGVAMGAAIQRKIAEGVRDGLKSVGAGVATAEGARLGTQFGIAFGKEAKARIEAGLKGINPPGVDVDISPALKSIDKLKTRLAALSGARVNIDVDTGSALVDLKAVDTALKRLDGRRINIGVDVDAAAAVASLTSLSTAVGTLDGRNIKLRISVAGEAAAVTALFNVWSAANILNGLSVRIDVTVRGNLAAITALGAVAAAATALGRMNPTVNVGTNAGGLNALSGAAHGARGAMQGLIAVAILLAPIIVPAAAAAAAAIGAIAVAAVAGVAAVGVLALAMVGVVGAVQAITAAQAQSGKNAAQVAARQSAVANALDGVRSAERGLASAQREAQQAQEALTDARKAAQQRNEDLALSMRDIAIQQRQANRDVEDAKKRLDAVLADRSASERQRAEARDAYDEAVLRVDQLAVRHKRAAEEKAAFDKKGVEGSREVAAAQDQIRAANERVVAAQQQLAAAHRQQAQAAVQAGDAGNAAFDKMHQALAKLSPEGRAFAFFIVGLRDELLQLQHAAERTFLPGLQRGITALLPLLPNMITFVERFGTMLGRLAEAGLRALTAPFWVRFFDWLSTVGVAVLEDFAVAGGFFIQGLAAMTQAFGPFAQVFGAGLVRMAQSFATWSQQLSQSKGFQAFINYVTTTGPGVLALLGQFVVLFIRLGVALAPLGALLLKGLIAGLEALNRQSPTVLLAIVAAVALLISTIAGGPIVIAVAATAIAGILVGLYQRFAGFRDGVNAVFTAVKTVVGTFVDSFRTGGDQIANSGFLGAVERVGKIARGVWDTVVAGYRAAVAAFTSDTINPTSTGGFVGYLHNLGTAARIVFDWFKTTGIPALQEFYTWIGPKASAAVAVAGAAITFLFNILNAWFAFLVNHREQIGAVFAAIGTIIATAFRLIGWYWDNILKPVFVAIGWYLTTIVGPWFTWLYEHVVKPVWDNIQVAISLAWVSIQVIFGAIHIALKLLGAAFGLLYDVFIRPVWEQKIRPLFAAFGNFITDTVAPAFRRGVEAVGAAWDLIREKAKVPVKFVIERVINDGIIGGFNWVADKVGVGKISPVALPAGFATGGFVSGPGSGTSDSILARLSNGEYVIPARVVASLGVDFFDQLIGKRASLRKARNLLDDGIGFKEGGVVDWARSAWDGLTDVGGFVRDKVAGIVNAIPGAGFLVDTMKGLSNRLVNGVVNWATDKTAALFAPRDQGFIRSIGGGATSGPVGWRYQMAVLRQAFPGLPLYSGYRANSYTANGSLSWHSRDGGRAVDIPPRYDVFDWIFDHYAARTRELIWLGRFLRNIKNGALHVFDRTLLSQHGVAGMPGAHIHWALKDGGLVGDPPAMKIPYLFRDQGGRVPPGLSLIDNRTGRDEWMFNDADKRELVGAAAGNSRRGAGFHADTLIINGADPVDIAYELDWLSRSGG
jgi:hypothetical protein